MGMMINRCKKCGSSDVDVLRSPMTNRYYVACWNCGKSSEPADTSDEAIADWNGALKERYAECIAPSWIYEDNDRFFGYRQLLDDVEKALGFNLFIWQKTYILYGHERRNGKTLAMILRELLMPGVPYIDFTGIPKSAHEAIYRKELIKIKRKLDDAGVETKPVLTSNKELHAWEAMRRQK